MQKLFLKKGVSRKSAYNLRNPKDDEFERHTLAILVDNESYKKQIQTAEILIYSLS